MIAASVTIADINYENDIFIIVIKQRTDIDGKNIIELFHKMEELSDGRKYKIIYDCTDLEIGHISRSAFKENQSNKIAVYRNAEAFVTNVLPVRMLINFYHKIFTPVFPSKSFKTVAEAKKWLKNLK